MAAFFGKKVLREVQEEEVLKAMPQLRRAVGDRAVLRALHFYADDRRAVEEADALERRDRDAFLQLVKESGRSSWELLQNITPAGAVEAQDMAIALEAAEIALNGKGACRVHGGGFAGTTRHLFRRKVYLNSVKNGIDVEKRMLPRVEYTTDRRNCTLKYVVKTEEACHE